MKCIILAATIAAATLAGAASAEHQLQISTNLRCEIHRLDLTSDGYRINLSGYDLREYMREMGQDNMMGVVFNDHMVSFTSSQTAYNPIFAIPHDYQVRGNNVTFDPGNFRFEIQDVQLRGRTSGTISLNTLELEQDMQLSMRQGSNSSWIETSGTGYARCREL